MRTIPFIEARRLRLGLAREREARPAREQLLEHHARLEPRERRAEAEVLAEAERDLAAARSRATSNASESAPNTSSSRFAEP
jgi:hypothetical protein